jgi:DNA-binding transcriptional regulator YhcF (GntR family)
MKSGYFYAYNIVFEAPVSGNAKLVYAYLCKCADRNGNCFPSHGKIAVAAGVCVTTVKKALAELERAGLIDICGQTRSDRSRRANLYGIVKEKTKGFFMAYARVFAERLTAKARLVYLYFCRLASGRGSAFPSHKTTAGACGLSVSGARAAVDELEAAGLVEREARFRDNGGQRSNLYTFITEHEQADGGNDSVHERNETDRSDSIRRERTDEAGAADENIELLSGSPKTAIRQSEIAGRDKPAGPGALRRPPCRTATGGTSYTGKHIHNEAQKTEISERKRIASARGRFFVACLRILRGFAHHRPKTTRFKDWIENQRSRFSP